MTMFRILPSASLLLFPIICFAASHEEVLRLNAEQKAGSEVVCHVPLNIIVDQKPVTLDFKNSMTVISNQGNNRTYQVITTFVPYGTATALITQRYRLNVITDETGQTHKIDPNSVSVTSPYSAEMAQKNETQLRSAPESYQSDSMVTVTDFPNYTIQGYENGPVTRCAILSKHE
ncbi:MAG: hypothetical protein E6661_00090 [Enterobacter sp.]|uniref:hypothetical protein n=1 Tax=Enterobacter TaxID=547 RepID=UPI0006D9A9AC|nr:MULTISPECIES: hypothetical protein [Enterobacter]MCU4026836.1 hypothetical protein [Enterobacter roggenkampii]MDU6056751.1 hypothetical protein [Enterobacter sp.]HAT7722079.1 hypothetical protein [Enterobacter roggenkampii]HAT7723305.1 hypothetical protein [Enterobacter roggenkampii]HDT6073889.1 hypothetical protein [Enterobacter roggenkampii]